MKYQKPKRYFEEHGSVNPAVSYHVPLKNVSNKNNQDIKTMVDQGKYFSIFAPRQSGKTTVFRDFCRNLENNPKYVAIRLSFENAKNLSIPEFYQQIQEEIYPQLIDRLTKVNCKQLSSVKEFFQSHKLSNHFSLEKLLEGLNRLIQFKKIVIFIDEFDGIPQKELENFLTTLRKLYQKYKEKNNKALYSVGLVGIRDVTQLTVGGVSPFNIADEINLPSFNLNSIRDLYSQYTEETNQPFTEDAIKKVYEMTAGQPWLVNRLGSILTLNVKPETTESITIEDIPIAAQQLFLEKNRHFVNLSEKVKRYKETFFKIASEEVMYNPEEEEQSWLEQFGLIKNIQGKAQIANLIYKKRFLPPAFPGKEASQQKQIFLSYSRQDKQWVDRITTHLSALKYEGIQYWLDENIRSGDTWSPEIQKAIENSQMAVCLISKNFLHSEFIREKEIPAILKKQNPKITIIPILIEHCVWERVPWLAEIQINPRDGIPLSKKSSEEIEEDLVQIVKEIGEIFDEF